MPIEANVWGTPKSSGSFRNLFSSRLLRAINYRDAPFEVKLRGEGKAYTGRETFSGRVAAQWPTNGRWEPKAIHLSCGSSDETGLAEQSIDLVVTDPPFFDHVHYSELADFFHAWQSLYPRGFVTATATTRHPHEVQDTEADQFAAKLGRVFAECRRVLKDDGLLVFTYHHSRPEGWSSLAQAVCGAGFSFVQAHPVKAEMSVAAPKSQAKEPIQLDVIFVCQKREQDRRDSLEPMRALSQTATLAEDKLSRLRGLGLTLSQNDCRVTVVSQFLAQLGPIPCPDAAVAAVTSCQGPLQSIAATIHCAAAERDSATASGRTERQLTLFSSPD
jgi:putative DNA methylase